MLGSLVAGHLFRQLVDLYQFYMAFPISNFDSEPVSDEETIAAHYARIQQLQLLLFYKHPSVRELALYNCGSVASRKLLLEHLQGLKHDELKKLVSKELRSVHNSLSGMIFRPRGSGIIAYCNNSSHGR